MAISQAGRGYMGLADRERAHWREQSWSHQSDTERKKEDAGWKRDNDTRQNMD